VIKTVPFERLLVEPMRRSGAGSAPRSDQRTAFVVHTAKMLAELKA